MSREFPYPVFRDRSTEDVIAALEDHSYLLPFQSSKGIVGVLFDTIAGPASQGIPNPFSS